MEPDQTQTVSEKLAGASLQIWVIFLLVVALVLVYWNLIHPILTERPILEDEQQITHEKKNLPQGSSIVLTEDDENLLINEQVGTTTPRSEPSETTVVRSTMVADDRVIEPIPQGTPLPEPAPPVVVVEEPKVVDPYDIEEQILLNEPLYEGDMVRREARGTVLDINLQFGFFRLQDVNTARELHIVINSGTEFYIGNTRSTVRALSSLDSATVVGRGYADSPELHAERVTITGTDEFIPIAW